MANDAYTKALKEILNDERMPAITKPLGELELELAAVSKRLQGHLSNVERLWFVEDRRSIQKQIAALRGSKTRTSDGAENEAFANQAGAFEGSRRR